VTPKGEVEVLAPKGDVVAPNGLGDVKLGLFNQY
jgi:hypothetical protein